MYLLCSIAPSRGLSLFDDILPILKGSINDSVFISGTSLPISAVPFWLPGNPMETAPIRPQPEPRCMAPDCPISAIHGQGVYLWQGEPPEPGLINEIFGPSNPPPRVVAAYELATEPVPSIDPEEQAKLWEGFHKHHTRPVQPNKLLNHTLRTRCKSATCPVDKTHQQGAYFHERRQHHMYTATFGFSNPPPSIWAAYERGECGAGTEDERARDREIVDAFVDYHGLFHEANPPRVRERPPKRKRSSVDIVDSASVSAPRGRGRPPKRKNSSANIVDKATVNKFLFR